MTTEDVLIALEPSALADREVSAEGALTSIAISLKRIADMLDGTTLRLNCQETIFNPQTVQNREVRNNY